MRTLNYYSSFTEFKVTGHNCDDLNMDDRPCFGAFVRKFPRYRPLNATLLIRLYSIDGDRSHCEGGNNNLLVDQAGIERQLQRMLELYYFTYKIYPKEDGNYEVEITGNMYALQWKLILTIFRHLYEFPYNVIHLVLDHWLQEGKLTDISYISAFNLIAQTLYPVIQAGTEDGLTYNLAFSLPVSNDVLKQRILRCISRNKLNLLNTLFEFAQNNNRIIIPDQNYCAYLNVTNSLVRNYSEGAREECFRASMREYNGIECGDNIPKPFEALRQTNFRTIHTYSHGSDTPYQLIRNLGRKNYRHLETWTDPEVQATIYNAVQHNKVVLENYIKEQNNG